MKKTVMAFAILFTTEQTAAQTKEILEFKKLQLGFNIGFNYSNVLTQGSPSARSKNGAGFRLGLIMSEDINKRVALSPKVELSFNDCSVVYSPSGTSEVAYGVYPVNADLMTHVIFRTKNRKHRTYFLAGPNVRMPMIDKEDYQVITNMNPNWQGNNPDFAIDLGFGFEKIKNYFILAPEFRYSIGLLNVNKDPRLDHVYFHNISFVLNFKG